MVSPGVIHHTVLLQSDGNAVGIGNDSLGQCTISSPEPGIYMGDMTFRRDLALQPEVLAKDCADTLTLMGSTLVKSALI